MPAPSFRSPSLTGITVLALTAGSSGCGLIAGLGDYSLGTSGSTASGAGGHEPASSSSSTTTTSSSGGNGGAGGGSTTSSSSTTTSSSGTGGQGGSSTSSSGTGGEGGSTTSSSGIGGGGSTSSSSGIGGGSTTSSSGTGGGSTTSSSSSSSTTTTSTSSGGAGGAGGGGVSPVVQIVAGRDHTCARRLDGELECWGDNEAGQLGVPVAGTPLSGVPVAVPGVSGVEDVRAAATHTCALRAGGAVTCWGDNSHGEIGLPPAAKVVGPTTVAGVDASRIMVGDGFTCAVAAGGSGVSCWGDNTRQSLGQAGPSTGTPTPVAVQLDNVSALGSCPHCATACAIANGKVMCWGKGVATPTEVGSNLSPIAVAVTSNDYDAAGDETVFVLSSNGDLGFAQPNAAKGIYNTFHPKMEQLITQIAGSDYLCAVRGPNAANAGGLACAYAFSHPPPASPSLSDDNDALATNVVDFAQGYSFTCVRREGSTEIDCGGDNLDGQLGDDLPGRVLRPRQVIPGGANGAQSLYRGLSCTVAQLVDGTFMIWGDCTAIDVNQAGPQRLPLSTTELDGYRMPIALGPTAYDVYEDAIAYVFDAKPATTLTMFAQTPPAVPGDSPGPATTTAPRITDNGTYKMLVPGLLRDVALDTGGSISFYVADATANDHGTLGLPISPQVGTTVTLAGTYAGIAAATWADHMCAWDTAGALWCWGAGSQGQVGQGGTTDVPAPVKLNIPNKPKVTKAVVGWGHTCALTDQKTVFCWGDNTEGQVAGAIDSYVLTPKLITAVTGVVDLATTPGTTCAALQGGGVTCWGSNANGAMGNGTITGGGPSAVANVGGVQMLSLVPNNDGFCGLAADGAVWCWGYSADGEVGDGSSRGLDYLHPVVGL